MAQEGLGARISRFVRDDSMSIALFSLFAVCLALQSVTGFYAFGSALKDAHLPALSYGSYLKSGDFLDGVFSNWQAAILQLAVLIAFSSVLRQRGAAHSKTDDRGHGDTNIRTANINARAPKDLGDWLYANSLSLVFFGCFFLALAAHAQFGLMKYNEEQAFRHLKPEHLTAYLSSPDFWESLFQTWEAEFFAIGFYIVASVFLRQESSSESKPVGSSNDDTGETNH